MRVKPVTFTEDQCSFLRKELQLDFKADKVVEVGKELFHKVVDHCFDAENEEMCKLDDYDDPITKRCEIAISIADLLNDTKSVEKTETKTA